MPIKIGDKNKTIYYSHLGTYRYPIFHSAYGMRLLRSATNVRRTCWMRDVESEIIIFHFLLAFYISNSPEYEDLFSVETGNKTMHLYSFVWVKIMIFKNTQNADGARFSMWCEFMNLRTPGTTKKRLFLIGFHSFFHIQSLLSWAVFRLFALSNMQMHISCFRLRWSISSLRVLVKQPRSAYWISSAILAKQPKP